MNSTWTPPPEMPSGLPPLPVGRNGKPLVYIGLNPASKGIPNFDGYNLTADVGGVWVWLKSLIGNSGHYAAESDSEICRLNQWGDFTPSAKPAKPAAPLSAVDRHLAQMRKEADDAEKDFKDADKAFDDALAWRSQKLAAFNDKLEVIAKLEGRDDENIRRAWYSQGRIDGRAHAPSRKTFPLHP